MTIEELRAYIKRQRDKAFDTFLCETRNLSMRARLRHDSSAKGVVDFAGKLLNLIDYGYEEAPQAVIEETFKKHHDAMSKGFGTFQEAKTFYEENNFYEED
jgi:hypothetical protein